MTMEVTITIMGITRTIRGDYDELHSKDWDMHVQDMLDRALEWEALKNER